MTPEELLTRAALPPTGSLLIALSGGADSAVAAWVAGRLAPGRVRAVHVHHGTPAAPDLAAAAGSIAAALEIPLTVIPITVPAGPSWEGQARLARWEAIDAVRHPDETVVTGHHADDLAETTLSNLMRGSGAAGLAAMAAARPGVVRPLLGLRRADVVAVAAALGLAAVDDPGNYDRTSSRNLLRHELIPRLEQDFNPQLSAALARTAVALAADDAALEGSLGPVPLRRDAWGAWKLPAPLITTADAARRVRLVRRLLRAARPPHAGTTDEIRLALAVAGGASGRRAVAGGWQLELEGPYLVAHRGEVAVPDPVPCRLPGEAGFGPLAVIAEPAVRSLVRRTALVQGAAVGPEVMLRAAGDGERIEINAGTKPVREVMAEAGVPRRLRPAWPVAVAHGRIAAVVGIRSAPWARGMAGEEDVFELRAGESWL